MNRRLFINQGGLGLALHLLPFTIPAGIASSKQIAFAPVLAPHEQELKLALQQGFIGKLERIVLTHHYCPKTVSPTQLQESVFQDMDWVQRLTGIEIFADETVLFADTRTAAFGSYSACFSAGKAIVIWQGLAQLNNRQQTDIPSSSLVLMGTTGTLHVSNHKHSYRFIDLDGRTLRADPEQALRLLAQKNRPIA